MYTNRRWTALICALLVCATTLLAQNKKDKIEEPSFPGGRKELAKYIEKNLVYTEEMIRLGKEGEVVVEFYVDRMGVIAGVNVVKSVSKELDEEAVRLTRNMPPWIPGKKNGVPVLYKMTMPIKFNIKRKQGVVDQDNVREFMNESFFMF